MAESVLLALSLDVEEEGLFGGRYICQNPPISNTAALGQLCPLLERGARPTFFCAWSAFCDGPTRRLLDVMRQNHGAQIAAHLHHWNTPPLPADVDEGHVPVLFSVPSARVPDEAMGAKLDNLFNVAADFLGHPVTAFRMGRWDLHTRLWPMLAERGILCDASVRPLHSGTNRDPSPDHFAAPADPYRVLMGNREILEVPLTVVPLHCAMAKNFGTGPLAAAYRASLRHWGALALLPIQHPLWLLKLTTLTHLRRGGRVLSLTWHSSEMMPGGAPHMPDQKSVTRFMQKMAAYMDWLQYKFNVTHVTMDDLRTRKDLAPSAGISSSGGDWLWHECATPYMEIG